MLLLISGRALSQNAYYDALYCASLRPIDADPSQYEGIHFTEGEKGIMKEMRTFLENPFNSKSRPDFVRIKSIFKKIKDSESANSINSKLAGLELISLLSPILNMSNLSSAQTDTLLYGLTIYLSEEFRKGYMNSYLNGINKVIRESPELKIIFPLTYEKLITFDPIRYKELGNEMKMVFDEDLGSSISNLQKHIKNPKIEGKFLSKIFCENVRKTRIYPYFDMSISVSNKLINGVHPSDIMGYLDEEYFQKKNFDTTISSSVHLVNILQRNLRDTASTNSQFSNVWINFEKLSKLNSPRPQAYFLALLRLDDKIFFDNHKIPGIDFSLLKSFDITKVDEDGVLSKAFPDLKKNVLVDLLSILTKTDEFTRLKDKKLLEDQNFSLFMKNSLDILMLINKITNRSETKAEILDKSEKILAMSNSVILVYNGIRVKNYINIPLHIDVILKSLNDFDPAVLIKSDYTEFLKNLDRLSSFSSGIVSAKTSEEVSVVIKSFAAPPASFINKRGDGFRVTLGAMPAIYVASEKLKDDIKTTATNFGLSLPLGLDFTLLPKFFSVKGNWASLGLFAQAIDLGAMLNYRLTTAANSLPDKVGWGAIFSPGVTLSLGLPKTPWNIQVGYQRGPELRKITKTGNGDLLASDRWLIRLAYDIPLLKILGR